MTHASIFVGIASYRDAELVPTLLDMIERAEHPTRLHIAVCWQDDGDLTPFSVQGFTSHTLPPHQGFDCYQLEKAGAIVTLLSVNYLASQGACWARALTNSLYANQRYHLQIDSHSRFIAQWDSVMITTLESLRAQSDKPVLTHYPPHYAPDKEASTRCCAVSRLVFNQFNTHSIPYLHSVGMQEDSPRRSGYLAAGFIFADGHFVKHVPYDPQLFFSGEEISLAARAFTHGYDLYTPHKVLIWHYYGRSGDPKFWSDHTAEARDNGKVDQTWWQRDNRSSQRIRCLLGIGDHDVDLGDFALGQQRSLQAFQQHIGVDFASRRIHKEVLAPHYRTWFETLPEDHTLWLQQLTSPWHRVWQLKQSDLHVDHGDVLWWQLSVHQQDNGVLFTQQLSPAELKQRLKNSADNHYELHVNFESDQHIAPHSLRLCPYMDNIGWGELREQNW